MWATSLYDHSSPPLQWSLVLGASLAAAIFDARYRRIPNALTGPLWVAGIAYAGWTAGIFGLVDSLAACALLALPYVLLFLFAGGGAGDAKLMGALGTWLGLVYGTGLLVAVSACGVVLGIMWATSHGRLRAVLTSVSGAAKGLAAPLVGAGSLRDVPNAMPRADEGEKMPYGIAICAGAFLAGGGFLLWQR
jgi:prepilin peptidase CpaA